RDQERVRDTRPHQRQRYVDEGPPAIGAQRLRRFFHRRRDAFDDANENEKRNRREREELSEQHALKTVDPARRRDVEGPLEQLIDEARAPEDQDEPEPDDERRRDDREHGQHAQKTLVGKRGAGDDQRKR